MVLEPAPTLEWGHPTQPDQEAVQVQVVAQRVLALLELPAVGSPHFPGLFQERILVLKN
jgi:hypothetical protein